MYQDDDRGYWELCSQSEVGNITIELISLNQCCDAEPKYFISLKKEDRGQIITIQKELLDDLIRELERLK